MKYYIETSDALGIVNASDEHQQRTYAFEHFAIHLLQLQLRIIESNLKKV